MKLSVIIPCYNSEKWIEKCIKSVLIGNEIEVICVNDGSNDATSDIIKQFDVKLIDRKENKGVGYSRNEGLEIATGEYVLFLDSDDYLYDNFKDFIKELDGSDIVYYGLEENDGTILIPTKDNRTILCGTLKAIRKEFIGKTRYPNANFAEDYAFNLELINKNPTSKYTKMVMLHYNHPREGSLFDIHTKGGDANA